MPAPILVTGAAGFAGSHLIDLLTADRAEIVAWHRPGAAPPVDRPRVRWQGVDILDAGGVSRAVSAITPRAVYHCAGAAHVGQSWTETASTLAVNVRGTHYLLQALQHTGVDARVLIPSSAMVYRPASTPLTEEDALVPASPYGLSKLAQEMLGVRASLGAVAVTIGRAFNHIGPRQDPAFAASGFARQIAEIEAGVRDPEVVVGNLDARREAMDVRDTVRAYSTILERGRPGRAYNVSSGHAIAIGELLEMLCARAKVPVTVRVDPGRFRPSDVPVLAGDSTRLQTELGWTPAIPLARTLDDLLDHWRAFVRASGPR